MARVASRLLVDGPDGDLLIWLFEIRYVEWLVEEDWVLSREVHVAIKFLVVQKDLVLELHVVAFLSDLVFGKDPEDHPG